MIPVKGRFVYLSLSLLRRQLPRQRELMTYVCLQRKKATPPAKRPLRNEKGQNAGGESQQTLPGASEFALMSLL